MALHLHRAERTDLLADGLGALLADPQPDPFAQELVLVAARGVERWLSQRLSLVLGCGPGRADGVCAGIAFRNPQSLIAEITGTLDDDPWSPEALAWPLLAVTTPASTNRGAARWHPTWGTSRRPMPRRSCAAAGAIRWRAG
ncbi:exonuclease V subunit gamma [Mycobacterium tuberculosis]|nr:exonuclease V subunit gamma [Mycobacterium tuberculosis]